MQGRRLRRLERLSLHIGANGIFGDWFLKGVEKITPDHRRGYSEMVAYTSKH